MSESSAPFEHALEKLEFGKVRKRVERFIVSGLGESLLAECSPMKNIRELELQQTYVSEMRLLLETEDTIPIHDIRDVRASLKRAIVENGFLEPAELVDMLYTLRSSRALHSYFSQRKHLAPQLATLTANLYTDKILERHIELSVDESGRVLDTASKRLRTIREDLLSKQELLRKKYFSILKTIADKEFTQDDIVTQRDGRMVIPVKVEHKRKVSGVVHSVSQTGQTVFIEPNETLELNNEIISLQYEEQKEISSILRDLTTRIRECLAALNDSVDVLKQLDFLYAKGRYSLEIRGTQARFDDMAYLNVINARHPLLIPHHGYENVQPLSLELGKNYSTLVISGPNTGGKTVALKAIGLTILLAQCGFHVSAEAGTTVPVCDAMFVDIGDDQSVENDLSTFSSHLKNVKEILEQSTRHSLILIDEIGSGTDPNEGGAFAMSVLANLTRRGVLTVVTTHHGVLKSFAHETPGAENAGMEFDTESLRPTYRLRVGIPGSSYAFEIADKLDFPKNVLEDARSRVGEQQAKLETLITDLERSLKEAREESAKAKEESARLGQLTTEYEAKLHDANKNAREIVRKAKEESQQLLEQSRALVENTIRELRETSTVQQKNVRDKYEREKAQLVKEMQAAPTIQEPPSKRPFRVGDTVKIEGSEAEGTLITLSEESGSVEVQIGALKVKAKLHSLVHADAKQKKKTDAETVSPSVLSVDTKTTIDLRGMYGDEALTAVENFLAEAVAANYERIEIIHGKGTGALRKYIHNLLKSHPSVLSFRLADWNAGGSGATIVELKK